MMMSREPWSDRIWSSLNRWDAMSRSTRAISDDVSYRASSTDRYILHQIKGQPMRESTEVNSIYRNSVLRMFGDD